jgi:PKHD-type hydroxylase
MVDPIPAPSPDGPMVASTNPSVSFSDARIEMTNSMNSIVDVVSQSPFQTVLKELYELPSAERPRFVKDVLLNPSELQNRDVSIPDDISVQRSWFSDERPTLFCLTKYLSTGEKVTITFDDPTKGDESWLTHAGKYQVFPDFLSTDECHLVLKYFDALDANKGRVGGNVLRKKVRDSQVRWLNLSDQPGSHWVFEKIRSAIDHFNSEGTISSISGVQSNSIQLTEYGESGLYGWHQDYGAGRNSRRRITASIQLDQPEFYEGGDLELRTPEGVVVIPKKQGSLVVFTSNTYHQVRPITNGKRRSLVAWFVE